MFPLLPASVVLSVCLSAQPAPAPLPAEPTPAEKAWQLGQLAMQRDRFEEAITRFRQCLQLDPKQVEAHLSLAAAHLAVGQDRQAVPHMAAYLKARPAHCQVRLPFAEVLLRLDETDAAQVQIERFVAAIQDQPPLAGEHLVGCHTRLMEIAERQGDEYAERLHRGIGLYLLAVKRLELGGDEARRTAEELLCKAAAELTLARMTRPGEARPCWYLHEVWTRLGQRQPAVKWLRMAEQGADFSDLTPTEQRELHLAGRMEAAERSHK
ncbi:MAG: tetratricopeptide repeat protein [Gemmataceae bacterium]